MRTIMRCFAAALLPILPASSDAGGAPPASTVSALGTVAAFACNDAPAREIPAAAPSQEDADDRLGLADFDPYQREGVKLTASQVRDLEGALQKDPKDLRTRLRLIGHHARPGGALGDPLLPLLLGLIENHPRSRLAAELPAVLLSGPPYDRAAKAWQEVVKSHPDDPRVLGNAGTFLAGDLFSATYRDQAEAYLGRARALEPDEPRWCEQLGVLHEMDRTRAASPESRRAAARKALESYEAAYRLTPPSRRDALRPQGKHALHGLATTAFDAGEVAKAKGYATSLLESVKPEAESWNYGNALFDAHTILGRVALEGGDAASAAEHLLEAGKTPGSPQLNSFGPNMILAQSLLEKGERDVVLRYFDLCGKFWVLGKDRLDRWSGDVKAGRKPDFEGQSRP